MQSMFRLPWSTDQSSDKALADKSLYQQKPRHKPRVEIPVSTININTKRKRFDSLDSTPKFTTQVKKVKCDSNGAVQPALQPTKGPECLSAVSVPEDVAHRGNTVKSKDTATVVPGTSNTSNQIQSADLNLNHSELAAPAQSVMAGNSERSIVTLTSSTLVKPSESSVTTLLPHPPVSSPPAATNDSTSMAKSKVVDVDKLRAVMEAQLNLEILHKHNELRLIEQELAKCQVGLEQLRRCEVIPYPGSQSPSQAVSSGTGYALASPAGYTSPAYPAPWGVADGPYTRHYAKWLLSDPRFDPSMLQAVGTPLTARGARATRGSGAEPLLPAPPPRNSRVSTGSRTQVSGDPTTPTAGRDPMVLKRQADGEWVRLRCNHCHRSNFNNVQGFLNHCRIAHHQEFKSHEAAAIACGEIVQIDETQFPSDPAPVPREPVVRPSAVITSFDQALVSPLISNPPVHSPVDRVLTYTPNMTPAASPSTPAPGVTSFKGSLAPHLSALMQRRGLSTADLDATIRDNKKRVDLSVYDDSDSERDDHKSKRSRAKKLKSRHSSSGQNTLPKASSSLVTARPPSQKGSRAPPSSFIQPPPLQAPSRSVISSAFGHVIPASPSDGDVDMELSPGTAADSNPGLVSDHDDDDDDADEARSTSGSHPEMMDVEIEDASDVEREGRERVSVVDSEGQAVCRREGLAEGSGSMC